VKRAAVLAVDGGGSKLDAALLRRDGTVLGAARVAATGYQRTGDAAFLGQIESAVTAACRQAGWDGAVLPVADVAVFCLAGADLPQDDRQIMRGLSARGWGARDILRNDTFAVLRAGTSRDWGVGVVCGYGTNCSGVAPDGRMWRLPAVGPISGDFGGASDLGGWSLWHAIRAEDGRGPRTTLRTAVPAHFGMKRPRQVMEALYFDRLDEDRLAELAPLVFDEAAGGDAVASDLIQRQADEIANMAGTAIRRLHMTRLDPDVVLGGGVIRNEWAPFHERIADRLHLVAPAARIVRLHAPPVVGAAMLGLDVVEAGPAAHRRTRAALTHERLTNDTLARPQRS
jgi:N-acetylglucosamine kinase-like BadF-type ATPase